MVLLQRQNWLRQKSWHLYVGEDRKHDIVGTVIGIWLQVWQTILLIYFIGWFICFYIFQYFKTPVIFLDKPHLFPVPSPTTQWFEMACGDALDNKPVPVWTSKLESPVLNPYLAALFLCSKSYPFLSSLNLYFLLNFSLIFYSILSTTFIFGQFPQTSLLTFMALLLKIISLLLRLYSTHSRLDLVTKISPK